MRACLRNACRFITCTQNAQYMAPYELNKGDNPLPNELDKGDTPLPNELHNGDKGDP